ncbi:MAG: hypothetical protein ACRDK4_00825 [Solirubrobacteraceae bacterium]
MAATATVRVTPQTRERLKRLSRDRGLSTPELLERLTRRAEDDQLLADHTAAIGRVMGDPEQAKSYRAEMSDWDETLLDGLDEL